ncbi:conserved hypothetical protein [Moraxellaceae bacterium 17A]|nr:conserved hypothetical protein [Moraxellaceae bacterium 17A]
MIYHTRHDIYHCCFRLISIISLAEVNKIEVDKIRIIDFYLVFPIYSQDIAFPRGQGVSKKLLKSIEKPFEYLPNKKILFSELKEFQTQALQILMAKDIININDSFVEKGLRFEDVSSRILEDNRFKYDELYTELIKKLMRINLTGDKGLKQRTNLLEYRYDAV